MFEKYRKGVIYYFLFYYLFVAILGFCISLNFLFTVILYFVVPSCVLTLSNPKASKVPLIFATIVAIPGTVIIDSIAVVSNTWQVTTVFDSKLFNIVAYEQFLWAFSFLLLVSLAYQFIFQNWNDFEFRIKNVLALLFIILCLLTPVVFAIHYKLSLLNIPYNFLLGGIFLFGIPIIQLFISDKFRLLRLFYIQIPFTFIYLIYELTALKNKVWIFPGNLFVGWVILWGTKLPYEEIVLFILLGAVGSLCYYELYFGKRKNL